MDRAIIDTKSGEVLYELEDGDRVLRSTSIDKHKQLERASKHFVKADIEEGLSLLKKLSANERSLMFLLQFYVAYDTCMLSMNGKVLTTSDIYKMSGWSRPTTSATLSSLIDKKLLCKVKTHYYMNPMIISRGNVNDSVYEMFKDYKRM